MLQPCQDRMACTVRYEQQVQRTLPGGNPLTPGVGGRRPQEWTTTTSVSATAL